MATEFERERGLKGYDAIADMSETDRDKYLHDLHTYGTACAQRLEDGQLVYVPLAMGTNPHWDMSPVSQHDYIRARKAVRAHIHFQTEPQK